MISVIVSSVLNLIGGILISCFSHRLSNGNDKKLNMALDNYEQSTPRALAPRKLLEDIFFKYYDVKIPAWLIIEIASIKPMVSDSFSLFARAAVKYDSKKDEVVKIGCFTRFMPIIALGIFFLMVIAEACVSYYVIKIGLMLWSENNQNINFIFSLVYFFLGGVGAIIACRMLIFVIYNWVRMLKIRGCVKNKRDAEEVMTFFKNKKPISIAAPGSVGGEG